jgi:hypothetical protein
MILTVFIIATIALSAVASALSMSSAAVVRINTVVVNGVSTIGADGSKTFQPDGTYTILGTIDNTRGTYEADVKIDFVSYDANETIIDSQLVPVTGTYAVPANSTLSFTTTPIKATTGELSTPISIRKINMYANKIAITANDYDVDNMVRDTAIEGLLSVNVDTSHVTYINSTDMAPNTHIDQGSMDDAVALYNNSTGRYSFSKSWLTDLFNSISNIFGMG